MCAPGDRSSIYLRAKGNSRSPLAPRAPDTVTQQGASDDRLYQLHKRKIVALEEMLAVERQLLEMHTPSRPQQTPPPVPLRGTGTGGNGGNSGGNTGGNSARRAPGGRASNGGLRFPFNTSAWMISADQSYGTCIADAKGIAKGIHLPRGGGQLMMACGRVLWLGAGMQGGKQGFGQLYGPDCDLPG